MWFYEDDMVRFYKLLIAAIIMFPALFNISCGSIARQTCFIAPNVPVSGKAYSEIINRVEDSRFT